jgi:ubiquinone/menaquinone biosynthesis C-methylase UbiE
MAKWKVPYLERTLDEDVPELRPYLRQGAKVLDVGCGPGTITLGVAQAVASGEVVGIDLDEGSIKKAIELATEYQASNVSFSVMDTHSLEFPDSSFDIVFSHTALHSFVDPVRALTEEKRVTKNGGWVIAAGVRDWGLVPRYPPTPHWDSVYEARLRYADSVRAKQGLGDIELGGGHPEAARRCCQWFHEAGFRDLDVQVKVYRVQHHGAGDAKPHPLDLLPYGESDEHGWYERFDECYEAMITAGFIDRELLRRATEEARAWYNDPRAFHFWVMVLVAGQVGAEAERKSGL